MRDFEDSTLWRISAFQRVRQDTGTSGFSRLEGSSSMLPSQFQTEIDRLGPTPERTDILEVMAACLRHRQSALLVIEHDKHVWPLTVFPAQMLVHSPRDLADHAGRELADCKLLGVEPAGVRVPGNWMHDERVGQARHYRDLVPVLWALALYGPRRDLLHEIAGTAAFRSLRNPTRSGLVAPGAMGAAIERLHRESAAMRDIAAWPGMSTERACRLLNALYLSASLMVTRHSASARGERGLLGRFLGGRP